MAAESVSLLKHFSVVLTAIIRALSIKFYTAGPLSNASTLIDLLAGYPMACLLGIVSFGGMTKAGMITRLQIMPYEFKFNVGPVIAAT